MAQAWYERLSGLDQAFLHFEKPGAYMHVALTSIFDAGSLLGPEGGLDIQRIRRYVGSRLHLLPRYRQSLSYTPLTNDPVWVDDDKFELEYHVRHVSLPSPGTDRQLQTMIARLLEQPLDRRRPLWEAWFIEGLAGRRFAMLSKVHHCMVDGIAGVDLLAALLGVEPHKQIDKAERWQPRPKPDGRQLLRDDLGRRARASVNFVSSLPDLWRSPRPSGPDLGSRMSALWGLLQTGIGGASETSLNQPIGPHRRVEWLSFDLADVKEVKNRLHGTLNDVVLATVAGAMREFFLSRPDDPVPGDFRALIPVSVRTRDERGETGNRVSMWITPLPLQEKHPLRRFDAVHATTSKNRDDHQEGGAELLTQTADWTTSQVLGLATWLLTQARVFNIVVTNVPGPPVPFYLLDAPMAAAYPQVPLFESQGLGIALLSYGDKLYWGLAADWDIVPDIHQFADCLRHAFAELRAAAGMPIVHEVKRASRAA